MIFREGDEVAVKNHPRRSCWSAFGVVSRVEGDTAYVEQALVEAEEVYIGGMMVRPVGKRILPVGMKRLIRVLDIA